VKIGHARRWLTVACVASLLAAPAASLPTAATPGAGVTMQCSVAPRSPEVITRLLSGPAIATPAATTGGETLPTGEPVNTATRQLMEETVRLWLACQNAGEQLRAWALFSDGYLYRLLSRQAGTTVASLETLATPAPAATATAILREIRDERLLPDGRLGATVVITYQSVPMPKTFFFFFTPQNNRLLIDGILGEISFSVP
jgi:hypothetical protein